MRKRDWPLADDDDDDLVVTVSPWACKSALASAAGAPVDAMILDWSDSRHTERVTSVLYCTQTRCVRSASECNVEDLGGALVGTLKGLVVLSAVAGTTGAFPSFATAEELESRRRRSPGAVTWADALPLNEASITKNGREGETNFMIVGRLES